MQENSCAGTNMTGTRLNYNPSGWLVAGAWAITNKQLCTMKPLKLGITFPAFLNHSFGARQSISWEIATKIACSRDCGSLLFAYT